MRQQTKPLALILLSGLAALALTGMLGAGPVPTVTPPLTPDPLAPPVLPESPTQVDVGRNVYYYNCMPCHGDHGQGLTDEWRGTWVEDHQNCWARGCHAGKPGDEGFPLPRTIPAVSGSPQAIANFSTPGHLFDYLHQAHPPQRPGALAEAEYWAVTAFLLYENGRLPGDGRVGPGAAAPTSLLLRPSVLTTLLLALLLATLLIIARRRRKVRVH